MPLALDQAGAYIDETSCSLTHYLGLYQKQHARLLKRRGNTVSEHDHPQPVANTWEISFHNVEKANPAAADLLRLCAFLAPEDLPEEIITEGADELGPTLEAVAKDPFELDAAIEELRKYSLVKRDREAQTLTIHRLVQAVLKDEMDKEVQRQWAERAVRAMSSAFPYVEYKTWPLCKCLLPHAQVCADLIQQEQMEFEEAARLLNQAAYYLQQRGQYTQAEPLYRRALAIWEKVLEPDHPDVAQSLNNLGVLYNVQGKYTEAESLYQRALAICQKVLEPKHPHVARSLESLAWLYKNQGKYSQAEPFYQQALAIYEQAFGVGHPNVARVMENYADMLWKMERGDEATNLQERAREIRERHVRENRGEGEYLIINVWGILE